MNSNEVSRRSFLKKATVFSAAASAMPTILTSVQGSPKPAPFKPASANDCVNLALVGIGNQGNSDAKQFHRSGLCNIVALCDVDMGASHTTEIMDMFPRAQRFKDFRQMFDKMANQIDAVLIATPDHSHFVVTMHAMRLGKHVYTEKPLARTFLECELLMEAERKYGVVTQMGNQGHSGENYWQFKAWSEAGIIKEVTAITAHMNQSRRWHPWDPKISSYPAGEPIPGTLNWDAWLAQAHPRDYHKDYHIGQWRCWYEYGMGCLGDWGAHIIDTAHEFLKLGLPYEVDPTYLLDHNPFFFPKSSTLVFKFPARGTLGNYGRTENAMPACDITWYDGLDNMPTMPEGYGGTVREDPDIPPPGGAQVQQRPRGLPSGKEIYSKNLSFKGGTHAAALSIFPDAKAKEMEKSLPKVPPPPSNHYENFLRACLGTEKANSPFSVSGVLSQVFCIGVVAQWTGKKVLFDRETKQITNDPRANQMLWGPVPREEYVHYYTNV